MTTYHPRSYGLFCVRFPPTLGLLAIVVSTFFVSDSSAGELRHGSPHKAQADLQTEGDLRERIGRTVGQADCDDSAQCRTLPVGWKACGGPAAWVAWSEKTANIADLQVLAEKLTIVQHRQSAQGAGQSNCQYLPDPGAVCVSGRCTLRSSAASDQ